MDEAMQSFLGQHTDLINNNDFKTLYKYTLETGKQKRFIAHLSAILLESEINPLLYMWYVPKYFLYGRTLYNLKILSDDLKLPEGIRSIEAEAFELSTVRKLTCPDTLKVIFREAFAQCTSLSQIKFNEGLEEIGEDAFAECFEIKELYFPDSLTHILKSAFESCVNLEKISLPKNISQIRFFAFEDCKKLKEIEYRGTIEEWNQQRENQLLLASNAFPKHIKKIRCLDGEVDIDYKPLTT